jgi:predicted enzyme related to lactoylglutathione lyase
MADQRELCLRNGSSSREGSWLRKPVVMKRIPPGGDDRGYHSRGGNIFVGMSICEGFLRHNGGRPTGFPSSVTPTLENPMPNPFVHVELASNDPGAAKAFYSKLFDWNFSTVPMPGGEYTMVQVGNGTGGGIMKQPMPGAPSAWLAYVEVADITAAAAKAKSLGATVMKDVTEVMGAGWLSIIVDPTGAALGLRKAKA